MRPFRYILIAVLLLGCARSRTNLADVCPVLIPHGADQRQSQIASPVLPQEQHSEQQRQTIIAQKIESNKSSEISLTSGATSEPSPSSSLDVPPEPEGYAPDLSSELTLEAVIASVYEFYPSLEAAIYSRGIADGEQLSSSGEFDTKLYGASENGPTGFYRSFRQSVGLVQPLYSGGELFAGYRVGRGTFEPWYKERQTNDGGEIKAGIALPLVRNRDIDERRAGLWRATYGRQIVEPEIQAQLIDFVQQASFAYWEWVAAGENYRVAEGILKLALDRNEGIRQQVENDLLDPPELKDNLRLIADRQAKVSEASQKLQTTAIKLSLYFRDLDGRPLIPAYSQLPGFTSLRLVSEQDLAVDAQVALQQRPELAVFQLVQKRNTSAV